jgi:bifunctional non-homologous end joining protein LigD
VNRNAAACRAHVPNSAVQVPGSTSREQELRFIVQEHHARTHHFDLRLEKDGVLKSWAVPKGLPDTPGMKRLAIQVEDHDLTFVDFEAVLPEGQYGAEGKRNWDRGRSHLRSMPTSGAGTRS